MNSNFFIVQANESGDKIFAICRKKFSSISKNYLRKCFASGFILCNNEVTKNEMKKIECNDRIELQAEYKQAIKNNILESFQLDILHIDDNFAILQKQPGVSAAAGNDFDSATKSRLWKGTSSCISLYQLEKSIQGLCIFTNNSNIHNKLSVMLHKQTLALTFCFIVCGKLGDIGHKFILFPDGNHGISLAIEVVAVSNCRAIKTLSMIYVTPSFIKNDPTSSQSNHSTDHVLDDLEETNNFAISMDTEMTEIADKINDYQVPSPTPINLHMDSRLSFTNSIKSISKILSKNGNPVAGVGGLVKASKGVYACLFRIVFHSSLTTDSSSNNMTTKAKHSECSHNDLTDINISYDSNVLKSHIDINPTTFDSTSTKDTLYDKNISNNNNNNNNNNNTLSTASSSIITEITTSIITDLPKIFEMPIPAKFLKLMSKEEELWQAAQRKDSDIIQDWQSRNESTLACDIKEVNTDSRENVINPTMTIIDLENHHNNTESNIINHISVDEKPIISTITTSTTDLPQISLLQSKPDNPQPVEYLLKEAQFFGHHFYVNENVMIPRKSSEILVSTALHIIRNNFSNEQAIKQRNIKILDLGTGSGSLLLSLLSSLCNNNRDQSRDNNSSIDSLESSDNNKCRPWQSSHATIDSTSSNADVDNYLTNTANSQCNQLSPCINDHNVNPNLSFTGVGIDISSEALEVAKENAHRLHLTSNTSFHCLSFNELPKLSSTYHSMYHQRQHQQLPLPLVVDEDDDMNVDQELIHPVSHLLDHHHNNTMMKSAQSIASFQSTATATNTNHRGCTTDKSDSDSECLPCGPFDVILCNPPYSCVNERNRLSDIRRTTEPGIALFAPKYTMSCYEMIAASLLQCFHNEKQVAHDMISPTVSTDTSVANCTSPEKIISNSNSSNSNSSNSKSNSSSIRDDSIISILNNSCVPYNNNNIEDIHVNSTIRCEEVEEEDVTRITYVNSDPSTTTKSKSFKRGISVENENSLKILDSKKSRKDEISSAQYDCAILPVNGYLILEIGHGQEMSVRKVFNKLGEFITCIGSERDYNKLVRCLVYKRVK